MQTTAQPSKMKFTLYLSLHCENAEIRNMMDQMQQYNVFVNEELYEFHP